MYNPAFPTAEKQKMYKQLAYEESVYIETSLQSNRSIVSIATDLKRSISTLRREIKRNLTQGG